MKADLQNQLQDCTNELLDIEQKINSLSGFDKTKIYLTNYALIKACGTIEFVYRSIVADFFAGSSFSQIHTYLDNTVRKGSMSATYTNMCSLLGKFDDSWKANFKAAVEGHPDKNKMISSANSLVNNRHTFAHGRVPSATFQDIHNYYKDVLVMVALFDAVVI